MLAIAIVFAAQALLAGAEPCLPEEEGLHDYHAPEVCDFLDFAEVVYAATYRGSLIPRPGSQQVAIYQAEEGWKLRVGGYALHDDGMTVMTRRRYFSVSSGEIAEIVRRVEERELNRLAALPYYGAQDVICTDGARHEVALARDGQVLRAARHSCSTDRSVDALMRLFYDLAVSKDASFADLLTGLDGAARP